MTLVFYGKQIQVNNSKNVIVLILVVMGLSSCGREKLTPIYQPMTVNELKNDKPINFSYQTDETQIDEYAKNAGKFPLLGKLFKTIAVVLANSTISNSKGHELDLDAVDIDLSSLSEIDFSLMQDIHFNSLLVTVRNAKKRDSLKFIYKLEIFMRLDVPVEGLEVGQNGYTKIVYFDSSTDSLGCDGQCINFNIANIDWKKLLQTNKIVHLWPRLIINSVPESTMKLVGSIDFSVKFNVGF